MTKKININLLIVITFFCLIFIPAKMPSILAKPVTIGLVAICLLLELICLGRSRADKSAFSQTIFLIIITIAISVMHFLI